MARVDSEHYRETLLELRQRLSGDVSQLATEALGSKDDLQGSPPAASQHPAENGSDNFEQEFTLSLMKNQEQVLEEIADALTRIDRGTFGQCEECATAIPKPRLQTLPYTRHCVACARKLQQSS